MIGYTSLGTNDLQKSAAFYDVLLATLGASRLFEAPDFIAWSAGEGQAAFSIHVPFDGEPATAGNGVMVALRASSPEQVTRLHARALELGARDEGTPGLRNDQGFFAAYFRDLDGNKLNAHCFIAANE
jgi:predicted lactoylglutathione lyase